jgi:hypothetical protein
MLLALTACNGRYKIKDGKVPAQFLPWAQNAVGTYEGSISDEYGRPRELVLQVQLDDSGRLLVSSDRNLLDSPCETEIGLMQVLTVSSDKDAPIEAQADFKVTNKCKKIVWPLQVNLNTARPDYLSVFLDINRFVGVGGFFFRKQEKQ